MELNYSIPMELNPFDDICNVVMTTYIFCSIMTTTHCRCDCPVFAKESSINIIIISLDDDDDDDDVHSFPRMVAFCILVKMGRLLVLRMGETMMREGMTDNNSCIRMNNKCTFGNEGGRIFVAVNRRTHHRKESINHIMMISCSPYIKKTSRRRGRLQHDGGVGVG